MGSFGNTEWDTSVSVRREQPTPPDSMCCSRSQTTIFSLHFLKVSRSYSFPLRWMRHLRGTLATSSPTKNIIRFHIGVADIGRYWRVPSRYDMYFSTTPASLSFHGCTLSSIQRTCLIDGTSGLTHQSPNSLLVLLYLSLYRAFLRIILTCVSASMIFMTAFLR
jgi:hypothetical protein